MIYTGPHMQLVLMTIEPGSDIGEEVHGGNDQFFRIEAGEGQVIIDGNTYDVKDDDAVIVPAGAKHNVINVSDSEPLKIYTIYAPPHHKDGIEHEDKQYALDNETEFDGETTE